VTARTRGDLLAAGVLGVSVWHLVTPNAQATRRIVLCLFVAVGSGCAGPRSSLCLAPAGVAAETVYLIDHVWHTGIGIRRSRDLHRLWPESDDFKTSKYLEVRWGDADYYRKEATSGLALQAAFFSHGSALHVAGFDVPPHEYYSPSEIIAIDLAEPGFLRLVQYIHDAYVHDAQGKAISLGREQSGTSRFYEARGHYSLLHNCNPWIAQALEAAGCPIAPAAALTAGSLMLQARRFGESASQGSR
jgi:uncharacterized protein (TIGR02117 family)